MKLYKYTKISEQICFDKLTWRDAVIQNIKSNNIWLSKPENMNDLYELKISIADDFNIDVISKYLITKGREDLALQYIGWYNENKDKLKNVLKKQVKDILEQKRNEIGLYSLSKNYKSPIMWSHYADNGKGVVIEYCIDDEYYEKMFFDVKYEKSPPLITIFDIVKMDFEIDVKIEIITSQLRTKHTDWKYEQEVRAISKSGGEYSLFKGEVNRIIIGPLFDIHNESNRLFMNELSSYEFVQAKMHEDKYEITV